MDQHPPHDNNGSGTPWTIHIPSRKPCRLFMSDNIGYTENFWLLFDDFEHMREAKMLVKALNLGFSLYPEDFEETLQLLSGIKGHAFNMKFSPKGETLTMPGLVSAIAHAIQHFMGYEEGTPISMLQKKADWSVEVLHPDASGIFSVNVSEPIKQSGKSMPTEVWLTGDYPEILDGFCALLSSNMAKGNLSRISTYLKALTAPLDSQDQLRFFNPVTATQVRLSSMSAYIANLVLHRYMENFYLDMRGNILPEHNRVIVHHGRNPDIKQFCAG